MNRETQKRFAHLPAIKGGVVTSVRELNGEILYRYRVPARVLERQRRAAEKHGAGEADPDDIGQGEGCEGGKCAIKPRVCSECGTARTCRACKGRAP